MRSLLKKILGDHRELPGDIATGDWSPVPAGVSSQSLDLEALLAEAPPLPRYARQDWEPAPEEAGEVLSLQLRAEPREPREALRFTPEELAIIEEQRTAAAAATAPPAATPETQPVPVAAPQPRQSWIEVLKSFGESLTDSELQIIRRQLAT